MCIRDRCTSTGSGPPSTSSRRGSAATAAGTPSCSRTSSAVRGPTPSGAGQATSTAFAPWPLASRRTSPCAPGGPWRSPISSSARPCDALPHRGGTPMTGTAGSRPGLTVRHDLDQSVQVSHAGQHLLTYVYAPDAVQLESPRPYFHPLHTRGGDLVSLFRPHAHVWHKGIAWSLPNVGPPQK